MFHAAFFALALTHNVLLIWRYTGVIKIAIIEVKPIYYELILIPTFLMFFISLIARIEPGEMLTIAFLIGFGFLNILYQHIWRIDNLSEIKYRIPFLFFYYSLHVGFVYYIFQWNVIPGFIILLLTLVQIGMNNIQMRKSHLSPK